MSAGASTNLIIFPLISRIFAVNDFGYPDFIVFDLLGQFLKPQAVAGKMAQSKM
jgi:hypothetical protein